MLRHQAKAVQGQAVSYWRSCLSARSEKKQLQHKVFGRVRISRTKTLCKWPFSVVFRQGVVGMSRIWVGTSRILKNFMQENFGLDFSYPRNTAEKNNRRTAVLRLFFLALGCFFWLFSGCSQCQACGTSLDGRRTQKGLVLAHLVYDICSHLFCPQDSSRSSTASQGT